MNYEIYMFDEESENLTLKGLMMVLDLKQIRGLLDEYYSDYDCKIIYDKLKIYRVNQELQYVMNKYRFNFQQAIDKLVDTGILKLY